METLITNGKIELIYSRDCLFSYNCLRKNRSQYLFTASWICGNARVGGGGTPLYQLRRYVPPHRVWFLSRFGLKTRIDFNHYGLKSGMVFKETTRMREREREREREK